MSALGSTTHCTCACSTANCWRRAWRRGWLYRARRATSLGFFAFIPTSFTGIAELGLIAGTGMFISLAASLSVLPALIRLLPPDPARVQLRPPGTGRLAGLL